jgi:hypothetical protein
MVFYILAQPGVWPARQGQAISSDRLVGCVKRGASHSYAPPSALRWLGVHIYRLLTAESNRRISI